MSQITTPLGRIGGSLMLAAALTTGLFGISTISIGDDDSDDDAPLAAFAENPLYSEECGACHLAYPPSLLPQASWRGIMDGLADHFGEDDAEFCGAHGAGQGDHHLAIRLEELAVALRRIDQ